MLKAKIVGITLVMVILTSAASLAEIPSQISFQGLLKDSSDSVVNDASYLVTFKLYDDTTGGAIWWQEEQDVETENGYFTVLLGLINPIPDSAFSGADRYLAIQITGDDEMTERIPISSTAYSYRDDDWMIDGDNIYHENGNVGIGTDSPEMTLSVRDASQTLQAIFGQGRTSGHSAIAIGEEDALNKAFFIRYDHDNNKAFMHIAGDPVSAFVTVAGGGNVGIGSSNPTTKLEVAGSVQMWGFLMPTGASAGYVLTSSATGVGTWQPAGNIGGSGTINYIPKFTAASTLGNTGIYETDGKVNIGNGSPNETKLNVSGTSPQITIRDSGSEVNQKIGVNTNGMSLFYDGGEALTVNRSSGNVGIGTESPDAKLDVRTTGTTAGVYAESHATQSNVGAIHGRAKADGGSAVYGETWSLGKPGGSSVAVYGWAPEPGAGVGGAALGVLGKVNSYQDPGNSSVPCGVFGWAAATSGINAGVWGETESPDGFGGYSAGEMAVDGDFNCNGTKSAIVATNSGNRALYCQESPEIWFEDFGEGQLNNGKVYIKLEQLFLETITINDMHPMKVFIQLNDDCNGVFVKRSDTGFDVIELQNGKSDASFTYRVVAKRKGYEDKRLEVVNLPETGKR